MRTRGFLPQPHEFRTSMRLEARYIKNGYAYSYCMHAFVIVQKTVFGCLAGGGLQQLVAPGEMAGGRVPTREAVRRLPLVLLVLLELLLHELRG